jgi:hypothetical protein
MWATWATPRVLLHQCLILLELIRTQHRCQFRQRVLLQLLAGRAHLLEGGLLSGSFGLFVQRLHLGELFLEDGLHLRFLRIGKVEQRGKPVHALGRRLARSRPVPGRRLRSLGHRGTDPQNGYCNKSRFHCITALPSCYAAERRARRVRLG